MGECTDGPAPAPSSGPAPEPEPEPEPASGPAPEPELDACKTKPGYTCPTKAKKCKGKDLKMCSVCGECTNGPSPAPFSGPAPDPASGPAPAPGSGPACKTKPGFTCPTKAKKCKGKALKICSFCGECTD